MAYKETINVLELVDSLTEKELAILRQCLNKDGFLRSTKPKNGVAAYVWRTLGFMISTNPKMHCLPMTANFGITVRDFAHRHETYQPRLETENDKQTVASWDDKTWTLMNNGAKRNAFIKDELDPIVDKIVNVVKERNLLKKHMGVLANYPTGIF